MDIKGLMKEFIQLYMECVIKAAKDFKTSNPVNNESLQTLNDAVRIMNHIEKSQNEEKQEH